jgi:hypothetical protein
MKNKGLIGTAVCALVIIIVPLKAQLLNFAGGDSAFTNKFEIGVISFVNTIHEKMVYGAEGEFVRNNHYAPGITIRFHRKHISFRTSFLSFTNSYEFEPRSNPSGGGTGGFFEPFMHFESAALTSVLQKTYETKFGLQIALFEKRLSSYLFMDVGYRYVSEKRIYNYLQNQGPSQITVSAMEKANERYTALHSGIGLRYQVNSWLSCAYECSMSGGISTKSSNRKGRESSSATLFNYVPALFLMSLYF